MATLVFGHKNPDTDSVVSAIATSYLKNQRGEKTIPCVLGNINKETEHVLKYFDLLVPKKISNVKTQVKDLNYDLVEGILPDESILNAYQIMEMAKLKSLPVVDVNNKLLGIITMKDIAMGSITGDFKHLNTSIDNIVADLNGKLLTGKSGDVEGEISIIAYYRDTIHGMLGAKDIVIVGDRYDIIEHAIQSKVQLIILTGCDKLPVKYIALAEKNKVPIVLVSRDTYTVSKLINQCNYVSTIMKPSDIVKFNQDEYMDDVQEEMVKTNFRNYPVVDSTNKFLGFINKKHLLTPNKKRVILVDHNEYAQSAEGLEEAEVLEIIDHHKIGDVSTSMPINFRNMPLGSTCTIIHQMFKEQQIKLDYKIAGALLSGIISDTLLFKSPTTTHWDKQSVAELNELLQLDLEKFAMDMFKAGTSLEGQSIAEIFYEDFKEFVIGGKSTGISQVFTMDIEDVLARKEQLMDFITETHGHKEYFLTLLVITDILKEGSYLWYKCESTNMIANAFKTSGEQGAFVEGLVSRKKQVVPLITEAINMLK